jgi:hypothetical protein
MQHNGENSQLSGQASPAKDLESSVTRRRFLSTSVKGAGLTALLSRLPAGWVARSSQAMRLRPAI